MLARLDPRTLDRIWFPLGEQTKAETRAEAAARASRLPEGGEPGGVLPRRGRLPLVPRPARAGREAGRDRRRGGSARREHEGHWQFTPGQRRGLRVSAAEPLYALATDARTNTVVVGPRAALARTRVSARGRLSCRRSGTAKLRYRSPAFPRPSRDRHRFPAPARRGRLRRGARAGCGALRRRRRRRFRIGDVRREPLRFAGDRLFLRRPGRPGPRDLPRSCRNRPRLGFSTLGRNFRSTFFVDPRSRT